LLAPVDALLVYEKFGVQLGLMSLNTRWFDVLEPTYLTFAEPSHHSIADPI